MSGLAAWIPSVTPATVAMGGTAFWGVDRGVDPTRLAGLTIALDKFSLIEVEAREGDTAEDCKVDCKISLKSIANHRKRLSERSARCTCDSLNNRYK
jgi:hypothetical protein